MEYKFSVDTILFYAQEGVKKEAELQTKVLNGPEPKEYPVTDEEISDLIETIRRLWVLYDWIGAIRKMNVELGVDSTVEIAPSKISEGNEIIYRVQRNLRR